MGYCKRCGTLIDESSEFCPQCGAPQQEDGQAAQTNQSSQNVQHNHECCCTEQSGKEKLLNIPKRLGALLFPSQSFCCYVSRTPARLNMLRLFTQN